MVFYLFGACLLISIIIAIYLSSRQYKNIDIYFWSMIVLIPIVILGYMMKARTGSVGEAKLAFCFISLDGTVLPLLVLLSLIKNLRIQIKKWIKILFGVLCFAHLGIIWAGKNTDIYYATFSIEESALGTATKMTSGPLKFTHYIYLAILMMAMIGLLIYAIVKMKDSSKKTLFLYGGFTVASIILYAIEMLIDIDFSLLPFLYVAGEIALAICYETSQSHDVDFVSAEYVNSDSKRGYVALGRKKELLCYNDYALNFVPEIKGKRIDEAFGYEDTRLIEVFYSLIDKFENEHIVSSDYQKDEIFFRCKISTFRMHAGGAPFGYLIEMEDVTAEQGYLNLIKDYGQSLQKEVGYKTEHIQYIQQKVVLGMATIIENRDMNTGGHVKRTSDIIKLIVDEMRKQGVGDLNDKYADEIIRSAPMHDLGKISIDNSILCKPAKLTDEEYAIMKTHSAKSGEIVKAILSGVEEESFVQTAYCLARFHHERWDGKGYPERLAQIEIPLEARIMAVADVYDALVSKRCYKQPMSFEKAAEIMLEGMGSQFDPMMKPIFETCRPQLEQYYLENNKE